MEVAGQDEHHCQQGSHKRRLQTKSDKPKRWKILEMYKQCIINKKNKKIVLHFWLRGNRSGKRTWWEVSPPKSCRTLNDDVALRKPWIFNFLDIPNMESTEIKLWVYAKGSKICFHIHGRLHVLQIADICLQGSATYERFHLPYVEWWSCSEKTEYFHS